ncbi:hypothetical protein [Pseudorhodobacter sp.]|uniref:hypothetical protein n=1 Tax=Pseudorhodobacter sp. TaxID=1934400 RepID=UPI002647C698|nr:hypothetical protein [Pseudorhodobacter sp.]MDN5788543.1 hypothetical protein [Pseudorhodobacter sp.]
MIQRALLIAMTLLSADAALGQDWTARKCVLYSEAWDWVRDTHDMTGIRPEFLTEHQSFLDRGCDQEMEICPVTPEEIKLVDVLTILSMNEGMASTFVPFSCNAQNPPGATPAIR